ncbi:hypothetical protein IT570_02895 [Candidatus Sumerlaeota bacterium]|nr:hypothetical protein [Candidatus Sumerlaeota bacterium]
MISLLRDNPIVTYYSPLSARGRRRWLCLSLAMAYVAHSIVGWGIAADMWGGFHDGGLFFFSMLQMLSYVALPSLCFLFFAPRHRSRDVLEELTLTRLSRREVVAGYWLPPLAVFGVLFVVNLASFLVGTFMTITRQSSGVMEPLILATVAHFSMGVIAASAATRNWTAYPNSVFRALFQVPIIIVAQAIAVVVIAVSAALAFSSIGPREWSDEVGTAIGSMAMLVCAGFGLRKAVRFAPARFFRVVDPACYQRAYWAANELAPSRRSPGAGAAFGRLLRRVPGDFRQSLRALMVVLVIALGTALYAYHNPRLFRSDDLAIDGAHITQQDKKLVALRVVTDWHAVGAIPLVFTLLHIFFCARKRPDRAITLMAGGIVPSIVCFMIPTFTLQVVCVLLHLEARQFFFYGSRFGDNDEAIMTSIGMFGICVLLALVFLPRPRRTVLFTMASLILLLLVYILLGHIMQYSPNVSSIVGALCAVGMLTGMVLSRVMKEHRHRAVIGMGGGLAITGFLGVLAVATLRQTPNYYGMSLINRPLQIVMFFVTAIVVWLVLHGFDFLAQRMHRMELAHLEPLTLNVEDGAPRVGG